MKLSILGTAVSLSIIGGPSLPAAAAGRVIITEIMYNPASDERRGEPEWVELANVGDETVVIRNWHLDDEDPGTWGTFVCTLSPGGVVVLCNQKYATEEVFRSAWDTPREATGVPRYGVFPVKWCGLANSPTADNEILQLVDDRGQRVCEVNIRKSGTWPSANGASIYLSDVHAENLNDGALWKVSAEGQQGAFACATNDVFNKPDVGSPGVLPGGAPTTVLAIEEPDMPPVAPLPVAPIPMTPIDAPDAAPAPTSVDPPATTSEAPVIEPDVIIPY